MERDFNDIKLFKYLKPFDNTRLSDLKGEDLVDLFILMDEFLLELRNKLDLSEDTTFGLEIEFEHTIYEDVQKELANSILCDWRVKRDISLYCGAEINSPILKDSEINWNKVDTLCEIISPLGSIDTRSGGHIHIGSQELGNRIEHWKNFVKLWGVYENIMYRFLYGEHLTSRPSVEHYATPVAKKYLEAYDKYKNTKDIDLFLGLLAINRSQGVNLTNIHIAELNEQKIKNTIEFRAPNGSLNPVIWQNNVNTLVKFLDYCKDGKYDSDTIEKRRRQNAKDNIVYSDLEWYKEIYLEQAIELADMLFHTNLEKVYFLKQYVKSFEVGKENEEYPEAKEMSIKLKKKIKK